MLNISIHRALAAALVLLVFAQATVFLASCTSKQVAAPISTDFGWKVQDPILSRFTHICTNVELNASGRFKKGTATFQGLAVSIEDQTDFSLSLKVPITNGDNINFGKATGFLTVSKPLKVAGLSVPQKIVLQPGKASAEVDIISGLGDFLVNLITESASNHSSSGTMSSIIQSVNINSMLLDLAGSKSIDFGRLHLVVGPSSKVALSNLKFDEHSNCEGRATASLTFEKGCEYKGKKTTFKFSGGKAHLLLHIVKQGELYSFMLLPGASIADLTGCSYSFGKFQQCEARSHHGILKIQDFLCQEEKGAKFPVLKSRSSMRLESSNLLIRNPRKTFTLTSTFSKPIPANLVIDAAEGELSSKWWTEKTNQADKVKMAMTPGTSETTVVLGNTQIGPVTLSKEGELDFSFDKGVSQLKALEWTNGKRKVAMNCVSGSTISIPPNMSMDVFKDADGTKTHLPLNLDVEKATIYSATSETELNDLTGKVILTVENGTRLTGGIDFAIVSCDLLGENRVTLHADGLNLTAAKNRSQIGVNVCSLNISNDATTNIINEQIPDHRELQVDKTLLDEQKWRYKNAVIKTVELSKITVKQVMASKPGEETFTVTGKAVVKGTIDKGGLLSIIKKQHRDFETKPWTASGDIEGDGSLKYTIKPAVPLTESKIDYELSLDLKPAKNVDLDWSGVDEGLLSKAENAIITKFISSYDPKAYLKKASFKLFKKRSKKLDNIVISSIKTTPTDKGLRVSFTAQVDM